MKTTEFKERFKIFPQRAWLSNSIRSFQTSKEIADLAEYLSGFKDIASVTDITELDKIRFSVTQLKMYSEKCSELIDEMELDLIGDFDDMQMTLEELGIHKGDTFVCTVSFNLFDMLEIDAQSEIRILDFTSAGVNSMFACKFSNWVQNENMQKLFPTGYDGMFLVPVNFMDKYFTKK
ncbi:hypothetical protein [Fluviicola chungangensis]|uniref:Uncharacterized protein n=1 Tax=Fluviicola chungangensis TaxID=2597671 RepID=A0A556MMZ2_9FLAO|nr:hypothetical protein [Fluviicola chungangensis]TSJ41283.1 hypothetical protein FO442_15340 [Fluviicola chungangensis]